MTAVTAVLSRQWLIDNPSVPKPADWSERTQSIESLLWYEEWAELVDAAPVRATNIKRAHRRLPALTEVQDDGLGQLTFRMDRDEIYSQAEQLAGKWKDYNGHLRGSDDYNNADPIFDPTPGRQHAVGCGKPTPVPVWSGIAWDVYVPPKTTRAPKVQKSWLQSVGPKNAPDYDSDDPYRPGGRLAIRQADRVARTQTDQPKYTAAQRRTDKEALDNAVQRTREAALRSGLGIREVLEDGEIGEFRAYTVTRPPQALPWLWKRGGVLKVPNVQVARGFRS